MRDEKKIFDRLKSDFDLLTERGYEVVGVFLQGSQNYNLDDENSDIDTKAILLPSFEDFLLNKKLISTTLELPPSNEHLDIKDARLMTQNILKQNINFVEILFTKYRYMNPKYENLFQPMFDNREKIARYDVVKTMNSIAGMAYEKQKAMEHPYPTLIDKINKFGFDGKQLSHALRLEEFIYNYGAYDKYEDCLYVNEDLRQKLIDIKRNIGIDLDTARELMRKTCDAIYEYKTDYIKNRDLKVDSEVDEIMTHVLINIFRLRFKEELK